MVFDPVMVATSGDRLLAADAVDALRTKLIPRADLITPNLPEAAALLNAPEAQTEPEIKDQAGRLLALGARAVLIKGGHAKGAESVDFLVQPATGARAQPYAATAVGSSHGRRHQLSSSTVTANR